MQKGTLTKVAIGTVGVIAGLSAGLAGIASAQTAPALSGSSTQPKMMMRFSGAHTAGKITAISGTTIMVSGLNGETYTVDAANAKVVKGKDTAATLADLKVGDIIAAEGTVSGTSVAATEIHLGFPGGKMIMHGRGPGVMGTVSSVAGNTLAVIGQDGKTYTVDVSGATIQKTVTITASDIKAGDTIGVMGDVSGNTITAKHVMSGIPQRPQQ